MRTRRWTTELSLSEQPLTLFLWKCVRAIFILQKESIPSPSSFLPSSRSTRTSTEIPAWLLSVNPLTPPGVAGSALINDQTLWSLRTLPGEKATLSRLLFLHYCCSPQGFESPSEVKLHLYLDSIYTVQQAVLPAFFM